jgi:hypothetical protein
VSCKSENILPLFGIFHPWKGELLKKLTEAYLVRYPPFTDYEALFPYFKISGQIISISVN